MDAVRDAVNLVSYFVIPLILVGFPLYGLYKRVPVYESFVVGAKEGFQVAKSLVEPEIVSLIHQDIGGDHQRIHDKNTEYSAITFKHLLLPAWVAVYRYHDQTYQILVNGRSGKVVGRRPWSYWKIARLVILILLAAVLVLVLTSAFGR